MKRYKEEIEQIKAILNAGLLQWKNKRFTLNQLAEKIDDETLSPSVEFPEFSEKMKNYFLVHDDSS